MNSKILKILGVVCLAVATVFGGEFIINDFKGMDTVEDTLLLQFSKSPDMNNCDISDNGTSISRRKGMEWLFDIGGTSNSFGSIKNDSYDRLLVAYGTQVKAVDVAYTAYSIKTGLTDGYTYDSAQYNDNTYCTNGVDTVFYTNGSSATDIASAPKGTSIVFFNNTCFIANNAVDRTRVYYAVYGDPTDWTTGVDPHEGDSVGVADYGERVVDLQVVGNSVLILCTSSILKMIGTQNPYQVIEVDKSIGCKSKGSVSTWLGWVYFLGSDGQMYRTNGTIVEPISEDEFKDDFANTAIALRTSNFSTITSQSEFATGITSHTTTSRIPGSVSTLVSLTETYTSESDWNTFALTNTDTTDISGSVVLSSSVVSDSLNQSTHQSNPTSLQIYGAKFFAHGFTLGSENIERISKITIPVMRGGSNANSYTVAIYTDSEGVPGAQLYSTSRVHSTLNAYPTLSWDEYTFTNAYVIPNTVYHIVLSFPAGDTTDKVYWGYGGRPFTNIGGNYPLEYTWSDNSGSSWYEPASDDTMMAYIYVDYYDYSSGMLISPIIDTTYSAPVWGNIVWTDTTPASTDIKYYARSSTEDDMGDSPAWVEQSTSDQQLTGITNYRYIQIKSTFTTTISSVTPQLDSVALSYATTGYYITPPIVISSINSWGLFEVNEALTGSSSISYYTFSSATTQTDDYLENTASWTSQTKDTLVAVSTNSYIWTKAVFTITTADEIPQMDDVSVNWVSGSETNMDMTAQWFKERLYLGVMQTDGSSTNDAIFVYDPKFNAWWKYKTGIYPAALTVWQEKFLVASSTSGVIAHLFEGDTDLGEDIDAWYYTKDMAVGPFSVVSSFERVSFMYSQQPSGSMVIDYYLNGSGISENQFNLDMTGGIPYHIKTFNFPLATNAYFLQFKVANVAGSDFKFHLLTGQTEELPFRIIP